MEQKFLDSEGVKHLWSKVNMQDYPNNEVLIGVINAIDETKADRSEIVQSDWAQNDPMNINYINNRTHYAFSEEVTIHEEEIVNINQTLSISVDMLNFETEYIVSIENNTEKYSIIGKLQYRSSTATGFFGYTIKGSSAPDTNLDLYIEDSSNQTVNICCNIIALPATLKISTINENIVLLDEKYIPDTIVRVSMIDEIQHTIEAKIPTTPEAVGADPAGSALESLIEAKSYTNTAVADLVNSAPETLDTLGELATAFEENADMVATLDAAVTNKAEKSDLDNLAELVDINAINIESLQTQVLPTSLILADAITGVSYTIQIQNGQLVSFETT